MKDSELIDSGVLTVFNSTYLVTKRNDLITARFIDMSYEELRLIDMLISLIQPKDIDFKPYVFHISDLMEFLGVDDTHKYTTIPKVTKRLMSDVIELKEKNKIIQVPFPWLSYAEYDKTTGIVTLKLNPVLKPYLLGLKNNFTRHKVFYSQILKKSKYSLRLYQILKRYEYEDNDPVIDLEELKHMLDTDYKEYKDFKRRILESSQKSINSKSDIIFK
ncbi:MAG: replication initiation protein [Oscillospiraceae bacterium]|nr:replication initiation protein [Oscillospiraceae bacterium]